MATEFEQVKLELEKYIINNNLTLNDIDKLDILQWYKDRVKTGTNLSFEKSVIGHSRDTLKEHLIEKFKTTDPITIQNNYVKQLETISNVAVLTEKQKERIAAVIMEEKGELGSMVVPGKIEIIEEAL